MKYILELLKEINWQKLKEKGYVQENIQQYNIKY